MREEVFLSFLDKAVAEGLLTQEEADEIGEWWQQKPEALEQGLLRHACGFNKEVRGGPMLGNCGEVQPQFRNRLQQGASRQFGRVMRQRVGTID